jgi:hypothetical protein
MGHSRVGCRDAGGTGVCPLSHCEFPREVLCSSAEARGSGELGSLRCARGYDAVRPTWAAIACLARDEGLLFLRASRASASCCGCSDLAFPMGEVVGRNVSDDEEW